MTTGKAIGHYADGKVAVVENRYGKGKAILFGSLVFQSPENASALLRLLPDEAQAEVDVPPGIFARTLTDDVEKATILINFSDRKLEARVKVDSADQLRLVWGEMEIRREKEYVILDLEPLESAVLVL